MAITIDAGDIIAGLALLLSAYATWKTFQFNERQKSLIESQEKLNILLLEKERNESLVEKKANLGASFIKLGNSKYKLKIWNQGKATAHHVRIEFPEGNNIIAPWDIDRKFPLETLETYQSVELNTFMTMGTRSKLAVKLMWSDEHNQRNEKTFTLRCERYITSVSLIVRWLRSGRSGNV